MTWDGPRPAKPSRGTDFPAPPRRRSSRPLRFKSAPRFRSSAALRPHGSRRAQGRPSGPPIARHRVGRVLKRRRNMPAIGYVQRENDGFSGKLQTLSVNTDSQLSPTPGKGGDTTHYQVRAATEPSGGARP